jgi:FeS assembly SUF system regulator
MLRISKLTDYGTLILVHLANGDRQLLHPASELAESTGLALPTVQKVLKALTKGGLVESARGTDGGYKLARSADDISAAEILDTLEGPVAITECSHHDSNCHLESNCQVGGAWQKISRAIRAAMTDIRLTDLHNPPGEFPMRYTILNESGHTSRLNK